MAFVVVTSLLGVVDQHFLQPNQFLNNILDDSQIAVWLSNKLRYLQAFLKQSEIQTADEALDAKIRDVAVEAEAKIESKLREVYLSSSNGDRRGLHNTLQSVMKEIDSLESRIEIHKQTLPVKEPSTPPSTEAEISVISASTHYNLAAGNEMIGCKDQLERISELLVDKQLSENREVIAVTGMGGIGKTTLARTVYEDPEIKNFFDISAWTVVSHQHNKKEIVLRLLGCIVPLTSEIYKKDYREIADQLRKSLMGQRYLIVLDDIWSIKAWDDIQGCFPDTMNASRILMTTRHDEVAKYVDSSGALGKYTHQMPFLKSDESWELFSLKVSGEKDFDRGEFTSIGKIIVEECQGLPLTIVVIAGLLAKLNESKQWRDVADNVKSLDKLMGMDSHSVSGVLALSYNNLPTYLRTCFLYLAIFPKDSDIDVKKLMKLWVAEGFLEAERGKSLEEVAMIYLYELIDRNLVLVAKQSFDGKIKSCRLHGSLSNFCLRKAKEENMLVVSDDYRDDLVGIQQSSGCCWMSCQTHRWPISPSTSLNYNWIKIRSLLYFGKDLYLQKCRFIFSCLKLLRVLDLSLIKYWNGMPSEIVNLIHLRYLALTTTGSLSNFQSFKLLNLQTLILFSWMEECHLQLPNDILDLPWLRHVRLDKGSSLDLPSSVQENLQTLFWLKVASWDSKPHDFTRVPNLKELGIYIEGEVSSDALDGLAQLYCLEKLKFESGRVEHFCLPISFPPNLKKLTLCKTYLRWEEMDIIGKLCNLEVLKLKDFAFCGPVWIPSEMFCRLKFLLVAHSDLEHWDVDVCDIFPVLECLTLRCCWYLKEFPINFAYSSHLRLIELIDCCPSLVNSAKMIQQEAIETYIKGELVVRHFLTEDELQKGESSKEERKFAI